MPTRPLKVKDEELDKIMSRELLIDDETGEELGIIEHLVCGHQNNLMLEDKHGKLINTPGVCPVCSKKP